MGIKNIPNQPIHFEVAETETCEEYELRCAQFAESDIEFFTQFELTPCNDVKEISVLAGESWTKDTENENKWCKTTLGIDSILYSSSYDIYGNYFSFTFTISNLVNGSIQITFSGNTYTYNSNGTFTIYSQLTIIPTDFVILTDDYFDGCFEFIEAQAYYIPTDVAQWINIYNTKDEYIGSSCIEISVFNNVVSVKINPQCLGVGCYYLRVCDPCLKGDGAEVILNNEFDTYADWTPINDGGDFHITIGTGSLFFTAESIAINESVYQPIELNKDCCYEWQISFGVVDPAFTGNAFFNIGISDGLPIIVNTVFDIFSGVVNQSSLENKTFKLQFCLPTQLPFWETYTNPIFYINFDIPNGAAFTGGEILEITSVSIKPIYQCALSEISCFDSNCFQILPFNQLNDTTLVSAKSSTGTYQLGFYWNGTFELKQRLNLKVFAPSYSIEGKDYVFSDGTKKITSAQKEKQFEFVFGKLNENEHDVLSTQILCKEFKIKGIEYVVKIDDYKPEWNKGTGYPYADVRLIGMKQGTILFKDNEN